MTLASEPWQVGLLAQSFFQGISLRDLSPGSSWTWQGEPLPYASPEVNFTTLRNAVRMLLQRPTPMRPAYESALEQAPPGALSPRGEKRALVGNLTMLSAKRQEAAPIRNTYVVFP